MFFSPFKNMSRKPLVLVCCLEYTHRPIHKCPLTMASKNWINRNIEDYEKVLFYFDLVRKFLAPNTILKKLLFHMCGVSFSKQWI